MLVISAEYAYTRLRVLSNTEQTVGLITLGKYSIARPDEPIPKA